MITGSMMFLVWRVMAAVLSAKGYHRDIYRLLVLTIPFWILPVLYLYIWSGTHTYNFETGTIEVYKKVFEFTDTIAQIEHIAAIVWLIGAVSVLVVHLSSYYRLVRGLLRKASVANQKIQVCARQIQTKLGFARPVPVLECYGLDTAIVVGVLSPKIILPAKSYTQKELEAVLYHELIHVRQHILLWKCIASFIEDVYWFNPISYWLSRELDYWAEVDCDIKACFENRGSYGIRNYFAVALALVESEENSMREQKLAQTTLFGKTNYLKERIEKVKSYSRDKKELSKIAVAGLVTILCLGGAGTAYAAGLGVQHVSEQAYDNTAAEVATIDSQVGNRMMEYVEPYDENAQPVVIIEGMDDNTRSVRQIDWNIPTEALFRTTYFSLSKGDTVTIALGITPGNKKVKAGILTETNTKIYVPATNSVGHTFTVDKAGRYAIFVENVSDVTVQVTGTAVY